MDEFRNIYFMLGVQVQWFGRDYFVKCKKEVILSSGTIGSPHILMHSGIGPKKHLQDFGVSLFYEFYSLKF